MAEPLLRRTMNTTEADRWGGIGSDCFQYLPRKNGRVLSKKDNEQTRIAGAKFAVAIANRRINLSPDENAECWDESSKAMKHITEMMKVATEEDLKILWNEYYLEHFKTAISKYPEHFKAVISTYPEQIEAMFSASPEQFEAVISACRR